MSERLLLHSAVACIAVYLSACAQKPPAQPKSFDFTESSRDQDAGMTYGDGSSGACQPFARYDPSEFQPDGPVTSTYDNLGWLPTRSSVVFHTLEESLSTRQEWAPFLNYPDGHLSFRVKGEMPVYFEAWQPDESRQPPIHSMIRLLEKCNPKRGLFQSLPIRVFQGSDVHMFECAPRMKSFSERDEKPSAVAKSLQAVWRVEGSLVKCDYPRLHVEFAPDSQAESSPSLAKFEKLPEYIQLWFDELLEITQRRYENFVHPERRPHDWLPFVDRYFYLRPVRRVWATERTVRYSKWGKERCSDDPPRPGGLCRMAPNTAWFGPLFFRHWSYIGAYDGDGSKQSQRP